MYSNEMKPGDIVEISFWDHCMNGEECECKVWGKVETLNRLKVELTTWELQTESEKDRESNREFFTILRKVIIGWKVLSPKK
jgi:hypothetical protein